MSSSSTLATILNAVYDELGLPRPAAYVGNSDGAVRQMLAHFVAMGDKLVGEHEWQGLITSAALTTVAGSPQYALPADFDGFIDETQWNTSARARVGGPRNQRDWAQVEGAGVNIGPYFAQQIRNNLITLQPLPTSIQTLSYYYLSAYWVLTGTPAVKAYRPLSDSDVTIWLDDRMQITGTKYRWLRSKGLDYTEERDEYMDRVKQLISSDRGAKTLSLDPTESQGYGQTGFVIPITGFGQ
jgi:hypothetical protein